MARQVQHPRGKLAALVAACRRAGLPLTVQRQVILEVLSERADHPTADAVYDQVSARLPRVSRATIYRGLETLVRLGVARRVSHAGSSARYDALTERHHHLQCERCGRLVDLHLAALDDLRLPNALRHGFEVSDYSVHFLGLCPACLKRRGAAD